MKPVADLFIPGIWNDDWCARAEAISRQQGRDAFSSDYTGGFLANVFFKRRIRGLVAMVTLLSQKYTLDIYAHSHGCKRALAAVLESNTYGIRDIHLLAAACPNACDENGINSILFWRHAETVTAYCSAGDKALALANKWLPRHLGFDDLGRTGPVGVMHTVEDRLIVEKRNWYNHSDWVAQPMLRELLQHL